MQVFATSLIFSALFFNYLLVKLDPHNVDVYKDVSRMVTRD
jgi:hypothetical protein